MFNLDVLLLDFLLLDIFLGVLYPLRDNGYQDTENNESALFKTLIGLVLT